MGFFVVGAGKRGAVGVPPTTAGNSLVVQSRVSRGARGPSLRGLGLRDLKLKPPDPVESPYPIEPGLDCYIDGVICIPYWDGKQIIFLLYPNWVCP